VLWIQRIPQCVEDLSDMLLSVRLLHQRDEMRGVLETGDGVEVLPGEFRWWTFAGGRINATLRYALQAVDREWTVIPDNFAIKIRASR
jgi:ATP-dependent Lhr-like helicase